MATNIPISFGNIEAVQIIGDTLNKPEFFSRDSSGTYVSYTGFTLSAVLLDSFNNVVATPTITATTATPPEETASVVDSKIVIYSAPADLPTKEGEYVLWITKVKDDDADLVETFMRIKYKFIPKKFLV